MKPSPWLRTLAFTLCMMLLVSVFPGALAATKAKTAEELGYLPPEELLAEDGQTIIFNDPWVQDALEQSYPHLMQEDGSFLKDSLKEVTYLYIGVKLSDDLWAAVGEAWEAAHSQEGFTAETESVDLSVLQFCTQLDFLVIIAQKVESLNAFTQSKAKYQNLTFLGGNGLNLDACSSITNLDSLQLVSCRVQSYEPLVKCKKLSQLTLAGKDITDIGFVASIPKLNYIDLQNAPNADLTPLLTKKGISGMALDMKGATEEDIRWQLLSKCKAQINLNNCDEITTEIVEKYLSKNTSMSLHYTEKPDQPVDFSALKGAKSLTFLSFSTANILDLSFLDGHPKLIYLYLWNSSVNDAGDIFTAPKMQTLFVGNDSIIAHWGMFEKPANAKKLTEVVIENTGLTDLSFVNGLSLKYLWLNGNEISDISPLANAKKIEKLSLSNNPITDFTPLTDVKGLKLVQHNSPEAMPDLKKVNIVEGEEGNWAY
ncbi:MAG: leucine-rich repeat domain-containing protein [Clostridia bacterium]|nr:leucine-rich repeat domain-containing protein [Clostridia bacterium]